jgi:purine-nucleoside phosphorylase
VKRVLAVIAGSGMGSVVDGFDVRRNVPFDEIDGVGACTVPGHAGRVSMCEAGEPGGVDVLFVLGRRHLYEGEPDAVRKLMFWVREQGVGDLLVTSAAGSLSPQLSPGQLVAIRDVVDLQNRDRFSTKVPSGGSPRPASSLRVHEGFTLEVERAALAAGVAMQRGALACLSGPTYETPAEVEYAQRTGSDVVTMSAAPEIVAANESGMRVAALAAVTNFATGVGAGIGGTAVDHAGVLTSAAPMGRRLAQIVRQLIASK